VANPNINHIAYNLAINCFAQIKKVDTHKYKVIGSTTEGALKVLGAKLGKMKTAGG